MNPEGTRSYENVPKAEKTTTDVLFELLKKLGKRGEDYSPDIGKVEEVEFTPEMRAIEEKG